MPVRRGNETELINPHRGDGTGFAEIRRGDGTVLWSAGTALPEPIVTQYEFEDDSDTGTATDSVGSNDVSISGASYTTTSKVGSYALSFDGSDDEVNSQSTVDLVSSGDSDACSIMAWVYPNTTDLRCPFGWWDSGDNDYLYTYNESGEWKFIISVDGNSENTIGPQIKTDEWTHFYLGLTQSELVLKLDGSEEATVSHDLNITDLPAMKLRGGYDPFGNHSDAIIDDAHAANDTLSDNELQTIIDRGS